MYKKILVPSDGSPGAAAATEFALDLLVSGIGHSITLLHVVGIAKEVANFSIVNTKQINEEIITSNLIHHGQHLLAGSQAIFAEKGLTIDTMVELADNPGERIIKVAQANNFDLIILGSRGLSPMKELILGSVSSYVLHNAQCPVVIYKS